MTSRSLEHASTVLSAVLQGRRDLMETALRHLTPEHFSDLTQRNIFQVIDRYAGVTGAVVTGSAFADLLRNSGADGGRIALYAETFAALLRATPADHEFAWSLKQLQEIRAHEMTGRALADGLEHLTGQSEPLKGMEEMTPHARARAVTMDAFSRIDRDLLLSDSPEGDVRAEQQEILEDYAARVAASRAGRSGVLFGLTDLDVRTSGLQDGDLALFAAYTSHGKTQLCVHLCWEAAINQGRNVFFATSETIRPQVRRRLVSRHSKHPQFGLVDGINSRDLKAGTLTELQESQLRGVVADLTTNPTYGKIHLVQIPRGATISVLESRLQAAQRSWNVDLVIVDYLALLKPERTRQSGWEEKSDMLKDAKQIAVTHDNGRGVPFVSPWQISRGGLEKAMAAGYYNLSSLSEAAEAEKSSDLVVSLLPASTSGDETGGRRVELKVQILKNRDGETSDSLPLVVDYATSHFTAPSAGLGISSLLED